MKKVFLLLILLAALLFTAGCTEDQKDPRDLQQMPKQTTTPVVNSVNNSVVELATLEQINTSLQKGPVLVKIGSEWCGACVKMKPVLKELAKEYGGKATIMSLDIDKSPELANYFGIGYIPDSFVIVNIEDGKYVYVQEDGNTSTDRIKSRILGLRDKEEFKTVLDYSLLKQG
jgi:thioredoxin-like negative regulator of GroEL